MVRSLGQEELRPSLHPWDVHADGLCVRRGRRYAINEVDLSFGAGVHGLLGPNGAGKTTLIRCLATVAPVTRGRLELLGQPVERPAHLRAQRRRIGYLPQDFGFYPRFTVREFVEYMAWIKEVPRREIPDQVQHTIERVGLTDRAEDRMKALSGGMLRRAGIAQALVNGPRLLILDEPTVGLDPAQRISFRSLLQQIGVDTCVIVSTHLVEDVTAACTDVVILDEGRVRYRGSVADIAAVATPESVGDSPVERGYSTLLAKEADGEGSATW